MDVQEFINLRPTWAQEPCLYILKQVCGENMAHRCGASGTFLYKNADLVYGSENAQLTGLLGRCSMYKNFWLPVKGTIYAALKIKRQLVANKNQKVAIDALGNTYNVNKGNQTLVLQREAEFHRELDKRNLRWIDPTTNEPTTSELFQPRKSVDELIATLRTIQGEEMFLFNAAEPFVDNAYKGGRIRPDFQVVKTSVRKTPRVDERERILHLKLSKKAIQDLAAGEPETLETLVKLIDEYYEVKTDFVKVKKEVIDDIKQGGLSGEKAIKEIVKLRRSARIAAKIKS